MSDSDITPALLTELSRRSTRRRSATRSKIVAPERRAFGFTVEPLQCLYPALKPIVGFARTATIRSVQPQTCRADGSARTRRLAYYQYVGEGGPKPAISIIQDLDGPRAGFGSFWGEVNSHIHKGLGCLGVVTDGSVRDLDANAAGFQMLCRMVVPSHAHVHIVAFRRRGECRRHVCRRAAISFMPTATARWSFRSAVAAQDRGARPG